MNTEAAKVYEVLAPPPKLTKLQNLLEMALPLPQRGHHLYFLLHDSEIVYVGKTNRLECRIAEHVYESTGEGYCHGFGITPKTFSRAIFMCVPKKDIDFLERAVIRLLKPKHNGHNSKVSRAHEYDAPLLKKYGFTK